MKLEKEYIVTFMDIDKSLLRECFADVSKRDVTSTTIRNSTDAFAIMSDLLKLEVFLQNKRNIAGSIIGINEQYISRIDDQLISLRKVMKEVDALIGT